LIATRFSRGDHAETGCAGNFAHGAMRA
jgi:hypothetical protein